MVGTPNILDDHGCLNAAAAASRSAVGCFLGQLFGFLDPRVQLRRSKAEVRRYDCQGAFAVYSGIRQELQQHAARNLAVKSLCVLFRKWCRRSIKSGYRLYLDLDAMQHLPLRFHMSAQLHPASARGSRAGGNYYCPALSSRQLSCQPGSLSAWLIVNSCHEAMHGAVAAVETGSVCGGIKSSEVDESR